jgi:hypothetical protein
MMCYKVVAAAGLSFLTLNTVSMAFDTLKVNATLDTSKKNIVGYVEYVMPDAPKLTSFEFQLYPNLYSSKQSPYLKNKPVLLNHFQRTNRWGSMDIDSVFIDGKNAADRLKLQHTRGIISESDNRTINGKSIRIFFKTWLPELGERLSFQEDDYLFGSWFPSPAIIKRDGNWHIHEYGAFAEPYGEFFYYEINFAAPRGLVCVSPVVPSDESERDGFISRRFSFGPAHDFALALSPSYLIDSTTIGQTAIRIFYRHYEKPMLNRIRSAIRYTFEYMTEHVGEYFYDNLAVLTANLADAGGIEFPGIIALLSPQGGMMVSRFYESLVIHEAVHQWFYGMVGTDQTEAPWMDEAVTNYFTHMIVRHYWGERANLFEWWGIEFSERDHLRATARAVSGEYFLTTPTYVFQSESDYFGTVYYRGALILETFNNIMGDSLSSIFWRRYFDDNRFRHPDADDFVSLAGEIGGSRILDALDVLLNKPQEIDYSVQNLRNKKVDSVTYRAIFTLVKKGGLSLPVDYRLILYNGDTLDYSWVPKYSTKKVTERLSSAVKYVIVDPDHVYAADGNLLNNAVSAGSDSRPGFRLSSGLMFLIESFLSFMGGM